MYALTAVDGFRGRIRKVAEDVQIVERGEAARQVDVDELQDAAPALEPHLDEDARAFLDVVAGRLDKPRHLPQFRHDAAGAVGLGRVGKQRLSREARSDQVRVELRIALPGAALPRSSNIRASIFDGDDGMFDLLGRRERAGIDLMKTPAESGQGPDVGVDPWPAQVLEQVIVQVRAVEARLGGQTSCR